MTDLLAHVLTAYAIGAVLSARYEWLDARFITVLMVGACIPEVKKLHLILPEHIIETTFGVPYSWQAFSSVGGVLTMVLIGALFVTPRERKRVGTLLAIGAGSHLLLDAFNWTPAGTMPGVLWPLTSWNPPTPGVYLSTQPEPLFATALLAAVAWALFRRK